MHILNLSKLVGQRFFGAKLARELVLPLYLLSLGLGMQELSESELIIELESSDANLSY